MRSESPSATNACYQAPVPKRGRYLFDFEHGHGCSSQDMSAETREDSDFTMETSPSKQPQEDVVKTEEDKLRAKYPQTVQGPHGGHAAFIQKRLAKGQKFFDSGDYNMYKQHAGNQLFGNRPRNVPGVPGGPGLPSAVLNPMTAPPTGAAIPTPETVPARKTSIITHPKFPMPATTTGPTI